MWQWNFSNQWSASWITFYNWEIRKESAGFARREEKEHKGIVEVEAWGVRYCYDLQRCSTLPHRPFRLLRMKTYYPGAQCDCNPQVTFSKVTFPRQTKTHWNNTNLVQYEKGYNSKRNGKLSSGEYTLGHDIAQRKEMKGWNSVNLWRIACVWGGTDLKTLTMKT